jgi:hypothetical protein
VQRLIVDVMVGRRLTGDGLIIMSYGTKVDPCGICRAHRVAELKGKLDTEWRNGVFDG